MLSFSALVSKTTICYKDSTLNTKLDTVTILDGGECNGKLSISLMEQKGWKIEYSQVTKKNSKYNHLIIFAKEKENENNLKTKAYKSNFSLKIKEIKIENVTQDSATIKMGNLKIGQSGVIIHKVNNKSLIISNAVVTSSLANSSKLSLSKSPNSTYLLGLVT
jgi:hypothetical protein